jgi:1D-myo-inositol-tetrakisphosphate 5-kinase/inositol-polyphosphate multikinase
MVKVYDNTTSEPVFIPKTYGKSINVSQLPEGIARFFPVSSPESTNGLPLHILLPILKFVREDVAEIRQALAGVEMRMRGGSVLIIYEADWDKAEVGVKYLEEQKQREATVQDDGEDDDEYEEDEDDDDENTAKEPVPYVVKIIDFAHTRIKPGEGPDEGVLLGLDTTLKLLDGRISQLCNNP